MRFRNVTPRIVSGVNKLADIARRNDDVKELNRQNGLGVTAEFMIKKCNAGRFAAYHPFM
jgi:hypothetical protein